MDVEAFSMTGSPTAPLRVLIVDDAPLARRLIARAFSRHPELEIAGTAETGEQALEQLAHVRPDLVVLDLEMPGIGGLETLSKLRKTHPRLPVIVFSSLSDRGARATLDAMARGASDCILKPSARGEGIDATVSERLVPLALALTGRAAPPPPLPVSRDSAPIVRMAPAIPIQFVVIATSTGGPLALDTLLGDLPAGFPVPLAIVQHMPPLFTRHLAERIDGKIELGVAEAAGGEPLLPGRVVIAPGGRQLGFQRQGLSVVTRVTDDPPENGCRPAADYTFRSAAETFGGAVLGVVLTGIGQDGTRGAGAIVKAGGRVIIQDEATSAVWGMPSSVQRAGFADLVLPLSKVAAEIRRRVAERPRVR